MAIPWGSDRLRPTNTYRRRGDSNGFQQARSGRHSNQFATKPPFLNSALRLETSTNLGDQGSQVRVLSPRRTPEFEFATSGCAVQALSPNWSRSQRVGI